MEETDGKIIFLKKLIAVYIIAEDKVNDDVEDFMFGYVECTASSFREKRLGGEASYPPLLNLPVGKQGYGGQEKIINLQL